MNEAINKLFADWVDGTKEVSLEDCHEEKNFLAPLIQEGRLAKVTIPTLDCWGEEAQRAIGSLKKTLSSDNLWISFEQDKGTKTTKVKAEVVDSISPVLRAD